MPTESYLPAQSIEDVISRLNGMIDIAILNQDPTGLFTALYLVVTERVRDGIREKKFQDNERMERLDVIFANRYLEAHYNYLLDQQTSKCWEIAFAATKRFPSYIILQELLTGMNAHINLDLGIAAATVAPGSDFDSLHHDFNLINAILGELTGYVQSEIDHLSPRIGFVDRYLRKADDAVLEFSMKRARDAAWEFGKQLNAGTSSGWPQMIAQRDQWAARFGKLILDPGFVGKLIVWWVKRREIKDVGVIIESLKDCARQVEVKALKQATKAEQLKD